MVTAAARSAEERFLADLKEFGHNADWFHENLGDLQEHLDLYVAVQNQKLVAVADDPLVLRRQFGGNRTVYIRWVGPPDLLWVLRCQA